MCIWITSKICLKVWTNKMWRMSQCHRKDTQWSIVYPRHHYTIVNQDNIWIKCLINWHYIGVTDDVPPPLLKLTYLYKAWYYIACWLFQHNKSVWYANALWLKDWTFVKLVWKYHFNLTFARIDTIIYDSVEMYTCECYGVSKYSSACFCQI